MGAGASAAEAKPDALDPEKQANVYAAVKQEYDTLQAMDKLDVPDGVVLPADYAALLEKGATKPDSLGEKQARRKLEKAYADALEAALAPPYPVVRCQLTGLQDAMDRAVYEHEKWPLVVDPSGQASRFLKYQRGAFLFAHNPKDMSKENLRRTLVGAMRHGSWLTISFESLEGMEIQNVMSEGHFPPQVLNKGELFKEEVYATLLRPAAGDPQPIEFLPRDEMKLVVVTKRAEPPPDTAMEMCVVYVEDPAAKVKANLADGGDPDDPEAHARAMAAACDGANNASMMLAFGIKETKRNSPELVEAGFDGDRAEIQRLLDKGYHIESEDTHRHTALSEAACQGHNELIAWLINDLGADPNTKNDAGRSPLWRAAFMGHTETVQALLESGADPGQKAGFEGPFDVAKDDATRAVIEGWDPAETERLMKERKRLIEQKIEARLTTAAEREQYAREKIRKELVDLADAGDTAGVEEYLMNLAAEADRHREKPRGKAELRNDRGLTLLMIAVAKGHYELAEMLLTKYETFDVDFEGTERKVFYASVKSRDPKGWNIAQLAVFHKHKKMIALVLKHGADPYKKNSYGKNAFSFAQDVLDAAREVVEDRSEFRQVLEEWEAEQNPKAAAERRKLEEEAAAAAAAAKEKAEGGGKGKKKGKGKGKKGKKEGALAKLAGKAGGGSGIKGKKGKGGKAKGPSTKKAAGAKGKKPELLKGLNKNKKKKKG